MLVSCKGKGTSGTGYGLEFQLRAEITCWRANIRGQVKTFFLLPIMPCLLFLSVRAERKERAHKNDFFFLLGERDREASY